MLEINPVAFHIFSFSVHWYGLAYFAGIIIAYLILLSINSKYHFFVESNPGQSNDLLDRFMFYSIIGLLLGGRLGYIIIYNIRFYINNPSEIIKVWHGGMAFHGALIGIGISLFIFAKSYKQPLFRLFDIVCYLAGPGIFLGRIANFINGELIGKLTNAAWAINGRHPSQIYEAIFEGLLPFLLLMILEKKYSLIGKYNSSVTGIFLLSYGTSRFIIEFFRVVDIQIGYLAFNFLTMGQLFCIFMTVIGMILIGFILIKKTLASSSINYL